MRQRVVACFVVIHLSISSTNFVKYEAIVVWVTLCSGRKSFNNAEKRVAGAAAAAVAMATLVAGFVFEHPAEEKNRRKCSTTRQF